MRAEVEMRASCHVTVRAWSPSLTCFPLESVINVLMTRCHFGGSRLWWECPGEECGRRVAILYERDGEFACRTCRGLSYKSQRTGRTERLRQAAERLRREMGWQPGIANGQGQRQPGTHLRTYLRLQERYFQLVNLYFLAARKSLPVAKVTQLGERT